MVSLEKLSFNKIMYIVVQMILVSIYDDISITFSWVQNPTATCNNQYIKGTISCLGYKNPESIRITLETI